jgi:hypothetical protein
MATRGLFAARSRRAAAAALALLGLSLAAPERTGAQELNPFPTDEAYLRYLGNNPSGVDADWTTDIEGISHDDTHWYLTQLNILYQVPLSQRLGGDIKDPDGRYRIQLYNVPELAGFKHFGDISVYQKSPTEKYVLVPVDHGGGQPATLALFRADETLAYVDSAPFPGQDEDAGWVAVDSKGYVYSSKQDAPCSGSSSQSCLRKYRVTWPGAGTRLSLEPVAEIPLLDATGAPIRLSTIQGGVVTPSDRILYLTSGWTCDSVNTGLFAFDLESGLELARSRQDGGASDLFRFEFDCFYHREPEGLTYWDLDGVDTPEGLRGQLHVLVLTNLSGQVFLKHYTGDLYVSASATGGDGRFGSPYGSLAEALAGGTPAGTWPLPWSGSTLVLDPGSYRESVTLSTPGLSVRSRGPGSARIEP